MNTTSTLIGFGAGALLAAGITYFVVQGNSEPEPAPATPAVVQAVPESAPLIEAPPVTEPTPAPAPVTRPERAVKEEPARRTKKTSSTPVAAATPPPAPARVDPPAPVTPAPPAQPDPAPATAVNREPVKPADPPPPPPPNKVTVAAGTMLYVRLLDSLDSDKNQPGESFTATMDQPLVVDGFVIAERGAKLEGRIVSAKEAGRVKGVSHMALELTSLRTSDGQRININTSTFEKEGDKSLKSDATKVAVGAGVGAALGAIFGGGKGAAIGSAAGAGAGTGTVLATRGKAVKLPAETRLTFSLKSPVTITEKR